MAEFNIQSDSVDVTRIMEQIRQRIHEKRGRDYTEEQIRELANVKLERFLDPRQVRSDLVEHYRQLNQPKELESLLQETLPVPELFDFDEHTVYASSRGTMGKLIRLIRKLLNPILKLFINPTPVVFALTRQAEINAWTLQILQQEGEKFAARAELETLNYEVLNNLVVEMTRLSVDMKNHRMLVESVAGRLDFDERRARALESVVQRRAPQLPDPAKDGDGAVASSTGSGRTRRRRRRPRRRSGQTATADTGTNAAAAGTVAPDDTAEPTPSPNTASLPTDAASREPVPTASPVAVSPPASVAEPSTTEPETAPAAAPSPGPEQPTPTTEPPVADAESSASTPTPSSRGPSEAPVPATAPAQRPGSDSGRGRTTETVAPISPTRDAGTDEQ